MKNLLFLLKDPTLTRCNISIAILGSPASTIAQTKKILAFDTLAQEESRLPEFTHIKSSHCQSYSFNNYELMANLSKPRMGNNSNPEGKKYIELKKLTEVMSFTCGGKRNDFYIFSFWQGRNGNRNPAFLAKENRISDT